MFYHLFTLVAKLTSTELAGRIANSIPYKHSTAWIADAAGNWLYKHFDSCDQCYEFVITAQQSDIHDECLADYRRELEEELRLAEEEFWREFEDEQARDYLEAQTTWEPEWLAEPSFMCCGYCGNMLVTDEELAAGVHAIC